MNLGEENKIARVFEKHYGTEDALEIEQCIKGLLLQGDQSFRERLIHTLMKNGWSAEDAQSFAKALTDRS